MPATKHSVDFTNVKEGSIFRPKHKPEGEYLARIVKVDDHQPNDKDKPMGWVFTITIDGDARSTYPVYAGPDEKQAWKVRKMFVAAGIAVPKKRVMVDPNRLAGKEIGVFLEDDEYEGRLRSRVADFLTVDEIGEGNDEAEDEIEEEEEEEAPPARKRAAAKKTTSTAKRRKPEPEPEPEDDEEEYDDEEEEEEPPPPPRKRTAAKKAPAKKATTRRRPAPEPEDDEDDVDDLDLEEI